MSDRIFDTGTDDINTEVIDGVMRITLNRPERRNAMSDGMLQGLVASLGDAEVATDVGRLSLLVQEGPSVPAETSKEWQKLEARAGTVPCSTTLVSIYSAATNEIRLANSMSYQSRRSRRYPARPPERVCRSRCHATFGMHRPTPSSLQHSLAWALAEITEALIS